MINKKGINVPDKTIAVVFNDYLNGFTIDQIKKHITKPNKKREWFDKNFYNCLPLVIGNQYGFIVTADYGFNIIWNGGEKSSDMQITYIVPEDVQPKPILVRAISHFGHGVLTLEIPIVLRTPPGVNLMTINPPNYLIKNATVMTGVVESDNIRMPFTFNLRIHEKNVLTSFPAGTPLAAFIPIPRMFADQFELKYAEEIFGTDIYNDELQTLIDHTERRYIQHNENLGPDRLYFSGQDIYGNKFTEHQNQNGELKKSTIFQQDTLPFQG